MDREDRKALIDPIWDNNPVACQVLGICSALAVTSKLETALVMGIGMTIVTGCAGFVISCLRNYIPRSVRIIVQISVVAALVIMVDQFLRAFFYDISKQLSVFVGLIITNTIVLGRTEGFAMANRPWRSFLDGIGNGLGYSLVLVYVACCRELLGTGKLLGYQVILTDNLGGWYPVNGLMVLSPAAFFLMAALAWIMRTFRPQMKD